jgi:branched-chain amino acid transport system permease protein
MTQFLVYIVLGVVAGSIYAIAASGLVVTYATSRIFNFAHGAIGMVMAYLMYQLWVENGLNQWLALAICLLVVAPAIGVLLDVLVMRHLEDASVAIRLSVTLTIFILCQGLAVVIWGTDLRSMPELIAPEPRELVDGVRVNDYQIFIVCVALAVAVGLWFLFKRTRTGAIMRGVVDDRTLTEMHGINPRFITSLSWALGCSLAALAAILLAPGISMNINALSLLVVSAYGAAIVGRLVSVPLTFVGAMGLGIATNLMVGYLPSESRLFQNIAGAAPFLLLFGALVLTRAQFALDRVQVFREPHPPKLRTQLVLGLVGLALVFPLTAIANDSYDQVLALGLVYAGVLLSLVLVAGMAGQVSLAQFTFLGVADVTMAHLAVDSGFPYWIAVLVATLIAAALGALVALPALRLRGLYLALSTLAFAVLADQVFFTHKDIFPTQGSGIPVPVPVFFGYRMDTPAKIAPLIAVLVIGYAMTILAIRKGRYGRALSAMRDAPAAASALGLDIVRTKMIAVAIASGMAGLMGAMYGGVFQQAFQSQFSYVVSLTALLILAIHGLTSVTGAIVGGLFYALFYLMLPIWIHNPDVVVALQPLGIGLAVIGLSRHPEGVIEQTKASFRRKPKPGAAPPGEDGTASVLAPVPAAQDMVGVRSAGAQ